MSPNRPRKSAAAKPREKAGKAAGARPDRKGKAHRFDVPKAVIQLVWIRAAGHCEQCGADLTVDFRSGRKIPWGDVAHIAPASADGPRAFEDYTPEEAKRLTSDPDNLMLLCPGEHRRTDRAPDAYPISDLRQNHLSHVAQIRHAAQRGETQRAQGLIVLGRHWATENVIRPRDLQEAMLAEGLWAEADPLVHVLPEPGRNGRDELYWHSVERSIDEQLVDRLAKRTSKHGDPLNLCVAGVADIPSLIRVGRQLGDRSNRFLYSRDRQHVLRWPNPLAAPPEYLYEPPSDGEGPIALLLSLSAEVPHRDVLAALPGSRLATFTTPQPRYDLLQSRAAIHAFRKELQARLSQLEAESDQPIHVFAAIPAALGIEFGALLSTQHAHRYVIYDREGESNAFAVAMELGPRRALPITQVA
jgi:hypothetical protein